MICKYCGREVKKSGNNMVANGSTTCYSSPNKKHQGVSDGIHCIYCAGESKNSGNNLTVNGGTTCYSSPNKKHML
jgi:hypothetical protein